MSDSVALSPEAQAPATPKRERAGVAAALLRGWRRLWFQDKSTMPLEIARIGIAAAILLHYGLASPHLFTFWGDSGWLPRALLEQQAREPWVQSVFFYFTAPWQWIAFHALFLFCCAAMAAGWRTSWVKWLVLVGEISYANRNPAMTYGVHAILACLLLILCFAPIGRALSLDRVRKVRIAKRENLSADPAAFTSPWALACTRLMQIQMALLFFFSGAHKLRGEDWWSGDAVWKVFSYHEYYNGFILDVLASHYWLVNVATYGTILIELAYPFLIWQRQSRPYMLAAAIFLHLQFAFLMYLYFFSFVMIMGHMSFLRRAWLSRLGAWWKRKPGAMEMIYDGDCGFCRRSMAWLLAFDGLRQIGIRDFRSNPSPLVSEERLRSALYLVLPDERTLPGFEAYRYVVLRVPGLWWLVPLFYVPALSRLFGRPIYGWIAANRSRL
jgi:predicted DCC family thiol-disulfide oxidoreductase YuxK